MADPIQVAAQALPADVIPVDFRAAEIQDEERWPLGLSVAFLFASSVLLWLPIIAAIRWLLA